MVITTFKKWDKSSKNSLLTNILLVQMSDLFQLDFLVYNGRKNCKVCIYKKVLRRLSEARTIKLVKKLPCQMQGRYGGIFAIVFLSPIFFGKHKLVNRNPSGQNFIKLLCYIRSSIVQISWWSKQRVQCFFQNLKNIVLSIKYIWQSKNKFATLETILHVSRRTVSIPFASNLGSVWSSVSNE